MIKVIINGAKGRMGSEAVNAVEQEAGLSLVAALTKNDDLTATIQDTGADVVVDLTIPTAVFDNAMAILNTGARPVIGTSGLQPQQIEELQAIAQQNQIGGVIAPNFSIGAVLMMKFAKEAARFYPDVEIIELHHDKKVDAPSGTALKTAQMIDAGFNERPKAKQETETLAGARGANHQDVHIHSIRLPGLVAHQEVLFGGLGETLSIRSDCINRSAFMPGICFSCKKVMALKELVYGLEHLLD